MRPFSVVKSAVSGLQILGPNILQGTLNSSVKPFHLPKTPTNLFLPNMVILLSKYFVKKKNI